MVRIAISQATFDAIASTLALGSVGYEDGAATSKGEVQLAGGSGSTKLRSLRGVGESYSDVIVRLAKGGEPR